jgi:hypothetical protein
MVGEDGAVSYEVLEPLNGVYSRSERSASAVELVRAPHSTVFL